MQYDFVIHFNNSINSKTTAVLIGCFFIEQSIVWLASRRTRREELRRNNVKPKTCLFTGQVDVQHIYMPFSAFTYVTYVTVNSSCAQSSSALLNILTSKTSRRDDTSLWF